ncbi:MAG: type-4 uracil-DNA glycosylase [Desulfurococcaceae archaeon]
MRALDPWEDLESEVRSCRRCRLWQYRKNAVPGEGNRSAEIMFVGEAPGEAEDETGRPFVGPAGRLLTELMEEFSIRREEVYITNVVKCRPPGNREPRDDEIEACYPFLKRQIELVKPRVIVALGRHAARTLMGRAGLYFKSMASSHGRSYDVEINGIRVKLFVTYHPASALYNPQMKDVLARDFRLLASLVGKGRGPTLMDFARGAKPGGASQ